MSKIECKYKYQYIEKFNGEKYCLCFNDLCKNLSFACDKNCQIFEDYKQLQQLKAENEELKENYRLSCLKCKFKNAFMILDEIEKIVKDFHLSMIVFHKGTTHEMADRIDYYLDKIKQLIKGDKNANKKRK